jgi:phosphoenolpyruvate-protein kinase (PTS system EI component)
VALCRELGIPCVVGIAEARRWAEGRELWLDGDAGVVVNLGSYEPLS